MVIVRTDAELRKAVADKAPTIRIDGEIKATSSIVVNQPFIRIIGGALNFKAMQFDGWTGKFGKPMNGLHIGSTVKVAEIIGVTFRNFECKGAALKGHATEQFLVHNCVFEKCGIKQFPIREPRTSDALIDDCVITSAIGAHVEVKAFNVTKTTFTECATNNHRWSHVIYASGQHMRLFNSQFSKVGNPVCFGAYAPGARLIVHGCDFSDPDPCWDPATGVNEMRMPYVTTWGDEDDVLFTLNRVRGDWCYVHRLVPGPGKHVFTENDYATVKTTQAWALIPGVGFKTLPEWRALGYDADSVF